MWFNIKEPIFIIFACWITILGYACLNFVYMTSTLRINNNEIQEVENSTSGTNMGLVSHKLNTN